MIYLALGDSITYGYDATDELNRYPTVLTSMLRQMQKTSLYVHAKPGWTSEKLLQSLPQIPQAILEEAGLITLMIGGNDLLRAMPWFLDDASKAMQRLSGTFRSRVLSIVHQVKKNSDAVLILCTVYNPFPKAEIAKEAVSWMNSLLQDIAKAEHCLLVPVHQAYDGQEERLVQGYKTGELRDFRFVKNPIHPNDDGHKKIASVLLFHYKKYLKEQQKQRVTSGKRRRDKRRARV